jgi:predicted homoserine dehydrogenase-like protein
MLLSRRTLDPVRVLLIGAGKFGAMFLSQARRTSGLDVVAVADLSPEKARAALQRVGWSENEFGARSFANAVKHRTTLVSDDTLLSRVRSYDRQS